MRQSVRFSFCLKMSENFKQKIVILSIVFLGLPFVVFGQTVKFNVDPSYDLLGRQEIVAELIRTSPNLYFYIEKNWWESRSAPEKNNIRLAIFDLGEEFKNRIYPFLTSTFGYEPKPGIDKDEKITILIHPMFSDAGGYSNSGDVYSRFQYQKSNEREMIYLNSNYIDKPQAKTFLAHEFMHLITLNQKDLLRNVTEERWLNELRAECAPTLLGYDNVLEESNLEIRVRNFLDNPTVSLTEWTNSKADYSAVNLFCQYLIDHYGVRILSDSLRSSKVGIGSLEEALQKQGIQKSFAQVFSDWAIALLVNDCSLGKEYCYLNENLKNLRIIPTLYFLPRTETILSTIHGTSYWGLNWHRFVGGNASFVLNFQGDDSVLFEVPYLLCSPSKTGDFQDICLVDFLSLNTKQQGKISIADFSQRYNSLTIIPFVKSKTAGFDGKERTITFSWKATVGEKSQTESELRNQLLAKIGELQEQVRQLQAKLTSLQQKKGTCTFFENNLYFGMRNNFEVRCLQEFLKAQGPEIYPEGLITGNFLTLTRQAVIRLQEKYASEILAPLQLQKGTGYVGSATRAKINQLFK